MKLYMVAHDSGENYYDLLVIANTPSEALTVWQDYHDRKDEPDFIFHIAAASPVGYHEGPKALEWGGVNLPKVGGNWQAG